MITRRPCVRRRGARRGFTLIELMVALVVSSLLVGMILAIFLRISLAYRGQQQVANVQQVLAAARATFELDAKQAGLLMAQGFTLGSTGNAVLYPAVRIVNRSDGPDEVGFYYADPSVQAAVTSAPGTKTKTVCDVDSTAGFAEGDLVVMSTPSTVANPLAPGVDANIATFQACVLRIQSLTPTRLTFSQVAPWGSTGNAHCADAPVAVPSAGATNRTMFYKLVARYYRLDPAREADGLLQVSPTGNLGGGADWQDLAYGFTDIQVATRFFDNDAIDSNDADDDPKREWYSGDKQEELTTPPGPFTPPIQMSISLVARTDRDVEGIATASTPRLTVPGNPDHNTLGDRAQVVLPSTDPRLTGHRIYRYTTFHVDLRNLGVGR
ncbi:MAG: PulJ/GspJ family protein [Kofleriaceae bacterium]